MTAVHRRFAALALAATLVASGCARDDGANTRTCGGGASAGSASGVGGGDCGGSASVISKESVAGTSDDPLVRRAVEDYQPYVQEQVNALVSDTTVFTDAVRAGDVDAAKAAYPTSRSRWERISPLAPLLADITAAVDGRAEDGVDDTESPDVTGWHQLEYDLWVLGDVSESSKLADGLDAQIAKLQAGLADLEITPLAVTRTASVLVKQVVDQKLAGLSDRYSHTDLYDIATATEGAEAAIDLLQPAIEKADAELGEKIGGAFDKVDATLAPYRDGDGWKSYENVTSKDRRALKGAFTDLSDALGNVASALDLE